MSGDYGIVNQIEFQGRSFAGVSVSNYGVVRTGDVVYTKSPLNSNPYGIIKTNKGKTGIVSTLYAVYRPKENTYPDFVQTYFEQHARMNNYMHPLVNKGAKNDMKVSSENALKGYVIFPNYEEQKAISEYFAVIDDLITLHQRMCVFFGSMVRIRMDSPLAFAWEQRKLNEVLTSLQNNTLSRADLSSEQGGALNVHYGDVLIRFGEYLDVKKEVLPIISDSSIVGKYKASFLQNGDVIVADTAEDETVGKCSEIAGLTDEIALSGLHTIPYRPMFKFASGFLGYYMNSNSYHSQLLPLMQGIKVTSISKSAMRNTDVYYPKAEDEQAEISTFFRSLDDLITLHQRKLKHTKNNK